MFGKTVVEQKFLEPLSERVYCTCWVPIHNKVTVKEF